MNNLFYKILFFYLILLLFDVFVGTPLANLDRFSLVVFDVMGFAIFAKRSFSIKKSYPDLHVFLLLFFLLFFISFANSHFVLKQSVFSALIANLEVFHIGTALFLLFLLEKIEIKKINIQPLFFKVILFVVIVQIVLKLFHVSFNYTSFFTGSLQLFEARKLNRNIPNLGIFLFLALYLSKGNIQYFFLTVLCLIDSHLFDIKRSVFMVSLFVIFLMFLKYIKKKTTFALLATTIVIVILFILIGINNQFIEHSISDLSEAFKIFEMDRSQVSDISTAVRIDQILFTVRETANHFIFGNGIPRAFEKQDIIDEYFYIADIGIFGIYYAFGLLGIVFYLFQLNYSFKKQKTNSAVISNGLSFFLIFIVLLSLTNAMSIMKPNVFLSILILISYFEKANFSNHRRTL